MNQIVLMLLLLLVGVTACAEEPNTPDVQDSDDAANTADDADTSVSESGAQDTTHATAESYWAAISAAEYRAWSGVPGWTTRTTSTGPHGSTVIIYANATVHTALGQSGLAAWPVGSWIIKDIFDAAGTHVQVASMEKRSDGVWFWAEYSATGGEQAFNKPSSCAGCHGSGDDFVRAFALP